MSLRDRAESAIRRTYDFEEETPLGDAFADRARENATRNAQLAGERLAPLLRLEDGDDPQYAATPDPKSEDRETPHQDDNGIFWFGYDTDDDSNVEAPDEDLDELWNLFLSVSLLREPIRNFASEVTEPGHRVEADDDEMAELLEEWADSCAVRAGEIGHDLTPFMYDIVVNKFVRGSSLIEHAPAHDEESGDESLPDDTQLPDEIDIDPSEIIAGLRLINPATVKAHKRPNKNVLLLPDDPVPEDGHTTDADETAAYVQYDDDLPDYEDKDPIPFSQNDITKVTLDADIGDAFGTGVVATVKPRVEALLNKLDDRDMSVHAKGHPLTIFFCGDPDSERGVWPQERVKKLSEQHKDENFTTKKKHFVPGDLSVKQVKGDVPDIDDAVMDDVEFIFASMPVPKYKIAYEESVNQFVVDAQEPAYERLVDDQRKELESILTPIFRKKAREFAKVNDDLSAEGVRLRVSPPDDVNPLDRDSFDPDRYETLLDAISTWKQSGAEMDFPPEFVAWLMGLDMDEVADIISDADADSEEVDDGEIAESPPPAETDGETDDTVTPPNRPAVSDDSSPPVISESNPQVQAAFEEAFSDASGRGGGDTTNGTPDVTNGETPALSSLEALAPQYAEGSAVATPNGRGVVLSVMESEFQFPQNGGEDDYADIDASADSPAYVVALVRGGSAPYRANALAASSLDDDGDDNAPETTAGSALAAIVSGGVDDVSLPEGWDRQSVLSYWSEAGGTFEDVVSGLTDEFSEDRAQQIAARFRDILLGTKRWRNRF